LGLCHRTPTIPDFVVANANANMGMGMEMEMAGRKHFPFYFVAGLDKGFPSA